MKDPEKIKELENILEKHHVKPTAMRILVLQHLLKNDVASSLTDIENNFYQSDRTTLFRTLKTFALKGIVHKIDDGTGISKYAMCEEGCECAVEKDLHLHFHCNLCKETICMPNIKIPAIKLPDDYQADNVNLVITGICAKCNKKFNHTDEYK